MLISMLVWEICMVNKPALYTLILYWVYSLARVSISSCASYFLSPCLILLPCS